MSLRRLQQTYPHKRKAKWREPGVGKGFEMVATYVLLLDWRSSKMILIRAKDGSTSGIRHGKTGAKAWLHPLAGFAKSTLYARYGFSKPNHIHSFADLVRSTLAEWPTWFSCQWQNQCSVMGFQALFKHAAYFTDRCMECITDHKGTSALSSGHLEIVLAVEFCTLPHWRLLLQGFSMLQGHASSNDLMWLAAMLCGNRGPWGPRGFLPLRQRVHHSS